MPQRRSLFWDVDIEQLNEEKNASFIIGRILDFGNLKEWKYIKNRYGEKRIIEAAKKHVFSDPRSAAFWARILSLPADQVTCTRNPSLKTPNAFLRR